MTEVHLNPVHAMPSGLCEDQSGEATALIGRMARGDGRALEELFAIWGPVFLGMSQRMLGDPQEAEKAVRETFVHIWRRSADYDPHHSPPFVWAFTILRELCIEHIQRQRKARKNPRRPFIAPPHSESAGDPRVMPLEDWRRLRAALDALPPDELGCLETAVFLGYARSMTPEAPDAPSATAKTCLRRALDKIRNQLSRHEL